jgi:hypothetical protein
MSQHDQSYIEKFQSEDTSYNGWKNHATWNVALWISNDEGLYNFAKDFDSYGEFQQTLRDVDFIETPDRVALNDSALDIERLDELIAEIV